MAKLPFWAVVLVFLTCWPAAVLSAPQYSAEVEGVLVVLYDEPCEAKAVANLPFRATWTEKGKVFNGCWGPRPNEGVVIGYFVEDRTVALIPIRAFKRVSAI